MTDAWFLSNNCVSCEASHVKFKTPLEHTCTDKSPNICRNRSKHSPLWGKFLVKVKIFYFWASYLLRYSEASPIGLKFRMANRTHVPLGHAKFHMIRCNESPLQGKMLIFCLLSKNITGSLLLGGNPASKKCKCQFQYEYRN